MRTNGSYERAKNAEYSPRVNENDPDAEPPEEYMFDTEDELAGNLEGNINQAAVRKQRAMRLCIWTVMLLVVAAGILSVVIFVERGKNVDAGSEDDGNGTETNETDQRKPTSVYSYKIIAKFFHSPDGFTQGLFWHNGFMYESDGIVSKSVMKFYDLKTGETQKMQPLNSLFGEGCALVNGSVVQLTWQAGKGFIYDPDTLELKKTWTYEGEGWGITTSTDGKVVYFSDGTDEIRRLDPLTLEESMDRIRVTDFQNRSVRNLNELEYINGEIWSNEWQTDFVHRIDPETGKINSKIDFTGLLQQEDLIEGKDVNVLNGIAYDPDGEKLYVTGKLWPKIYQVEITDPNDTEREVHR